MLSPSHPPHQSTSSSDDYYTTSMFVSRAESVLGPWSKPAPLNFSLSDGGTTFCGGTNPAPHFNADGSVDLAFNAGYCDDDADAAAKHKSGGEFVWVASAPSWNAPFELVFPQPITPRSGNMHPVCVAGVDEDPFLWRSERG
jgi:hypothetical protein